MRLRASLIAGFLLLGASVAHSEITVEQVAGKTLTGADKSKFENSADGSLTGVTGKGDALSGTWEIKDGKWCRTIKEPARLAGSACQTASIKGGTFTLVRDDGSSVKYKIK